MATPSTPATPTLKRTPSRFSRALKRVKVDACIEKYVRVLVKYPHWNCMGCTCVLFLLAVVVIGGGLWQFSEDSSYDWNISSKEASKRRDAVESALSQLDSTGTAESAVPRRNPENPLIYMFTWRDGRSESIFTAANLQHICRLEDLMLSNAQYPEFCWVNTTSTACRTDYPFSVVRQFYGSNRAGCPLLSDTHVGSIAQTMYDGLNSNEGTREYGYFMSSIANATKISARTRSAIYLGSPRPGFRNIDDRKDDQYSQYKDFMEEVENSIMDFFGFSFTFFKSAYVNDFFVGDMRVKFMSQSFFDLEFPRLINADMTWTACSILFVFSYIWYHSGSLFLTLVGMYQIVISLPVAFFIYRVIFQIKYFTTLHVLVIFLVLGVGADDIFVFVDSWKIARQLDSHISGSLTARLLYAYKRTRSAVFNTSFTTAMAFCATALSPIMPISSFGIYATLAIILNYVFVITLTPAAIVVWHLHFEGRNLCACCCRKERKGRKAPVAATKAKSSAAGGEGAKPAQGDVELTHVKPSVAVRPISDEADDVEEGKAGPSPPPSSKTEHGAGAEEEGDVDGKDEPQVSQNVSRTPPSAPDADVPAEEEGGDSPLPDATSRPSAKRSRMERFFSEWYAPLLGREMGGVRVYALAIALLLLAVATFFLSMALQLRPPTRQEEWFASDHMFNGIGDELRDQYLAASADDYVPMEVAIGIAGIDRSGFVRWEPDKNRGTAEFDARFDLTQAAAQTAFVAMCDDITTLPCSLEGCTGGFGTLALPGEPVKCWVRAFYQWKNATVGSITGSAFLTEAAAFRANNVDYEKSVGIINGELKFSLIQFVSTMLKYQPSTVIEPIWDLVNSVAATMESQHGQYLGRIFINADQWFTWMQTEKGLISNMFQGMAIGFPTAFVVLIVSTGNYILSLYAVVTIAFIVSLVLGWSEFVMGWDLGVAESIAAVIVVGFSVDYCVHLAHSYEVAPNKDRAGRVHFAASTMGFTVVAGAVTTFGAGAFMWAAQMTFFTKMGTLIAVTIAGSIIYSLGFFLSVSALIGPEGDEGSIWLLFHRIRNWVRQRRGQEPLPWEGVNKRKESAPESATPRSSRTPAGDPPSKELDP